MSASTKRLAVLYTSMTDWMSLKNEPMIVKHEGNICQRSTSNNAMLYKCQVPVDLIFAC